MDGAGAPTVSVVVPTTGPAWIGGPACARLAAAAAAVGGELIVATAHPPPGRVPAGATVLTAPGASVFELRAGGVNRARGPIVALTEDHALPAPDWCAQVMDAHRRHPLAAAIGGAVVNGSAGRLFDWANFLMTFGTFMPPPPPASLDRAPAIANVSVRREALPGHLPLRPGELEFVLMPALVAAHRVVLDGAPRVAHVQSWGAAGTQRAHFHNGRSTAGLAAEGGGWRERRLFLRRGRPAELWAQVRRSVDGKRLPPRARAGLALVPLLCGAHAAGEWVGALAGPGRSPGRLR